MHWTATGNKAWITPWNHRLRHRTQTRHQSPETLIFAFWRQFRQQKTQFFFFPSNFFCHFEIRAPRAINWREKIFYFIGTLRLKIKKRFSQITLLQTYKFYFINKRRQRSDLLKTRGKQLVGETTAYYFSVSANSSKIISLQKVGFPCLELRYL